MELNETMNLKQPSRFFLISILGIVLYVILDAVAQILPPHYSPIRQAESDLAIGKYGFIMTINFVNRSLLSLAFIFGFLQMLDLAGVPRQKFRAGTILLGIWAVGALLLAAFPTDVPSTPVSLHGAIHLIVALIAFIAGAFGTLAISSRLEGNNVLQSLKRIAMPLSVLVLIFWVIEFGLTFAVPHLNARFGGLTERLFLGSVLLWIGVASGYLTIHIREIKMVLNQTKA